MLPPQGLPASPSLALPGLGELIAGRYRIDRKLGHGGMGVVVAAFDEQSQVEVAIKLLRPEEMAPSPAFQSADDSSALERSSRHQQMSTRLIREASAASRISSEHVARVLDVGRLASGDPYVVMELLDGMDLGRYVKRRGQLSIAEAVNLVLQASEAIVEAHALGIVHRDLKPANLFLTRRADGTPWVKVLDFGISKVLGHDDNQLTGTSDMLGSPLYMAPEQIRSARDVDDRADVWSMGAILYRLLAGRAAFEAQGSAATLAAIIGDQPASLREIRPDVPADLEAIVFRCLEKDRNRRIQSVRELAIALQRFAVAQSGALLPAVSLTPSGGNPALYAAGVPGAPGMPTFTPPTGSPGMPGTHVYTTGGGPPSLASVAPNAVTVAGPRRGSIAWIAAVAGVLGVLAAGVLIGWKVIGGAPGEGPSAGAASPGGSVATVSAPATVAPPVTAATSGAAASAVTATTSATGAASATPATSATPAVAGSTSAAPSTSASAGAKAPVKPIRKPSEDPLGDRL